MNKNFKFKRGEIYQLISHPECIVEYTGGGKGKGIAIGGIKGEGIGIDDPTLWRIFIPLSPAAFSHKNMEVREEFQNIDPSDTNLDRMSKTLGEEVTTVGEPSEDQKTLAAMQEMSDEKSASRVFESGASRNSDEGKLDFEGFLSPTVLKAYAEYMHKNRFLESGQMRDSDNWQKGIPVDAYMKSMWRHFFDTWNRHRGIETPESQKENLSGLLFNVMGMLHELLKEESNN